MSNAHGWATGPVSALSMYAVGMSQTSWVGRQWAVTPQPGDLRQAEGRLLLDGDSGYLVVSWVLDDANRMTLTVDPTALHACPTAVGAIGVPMTNATTVVVNGKVAWANRAYQGGILGITSADSEDGSYVFLRNVQPSHKFVIQTR